MAIVYLKMLKGKIHQIDFKKILVQNSAPNCLAPKRVQIVVHDKGAVVHPSLHVSFVVFMLGDVLTVVVIYQDVVGDVSLELASSRLAFASAENYNSIVKVMG